MIAYLVESSQETSLNTSGLKQLKLIVFDVDGVFTDGQTWQDATGSWRRYFSVRDAMAVRALRRAGFMVAVITSASSPEIREQMSQMGIEELFEDRDDKESVIRELLSRHSLEASEVALMSEDIHDLSLMQSLGAGITVPLAPKALRESALLVTARSGGDGAVFEACKMILQQSETSSDAARRPRPWSDQSS